MRGFPFPPRTILGHQVPNRFRRWTIHVRDPGWLLTDFIRWLESEEAAAAPERARAARPEQRRDDAGAGERAYLVEQCIALIPLARTDALRQRLEDVLERVGVTAYDGRSEEFDPSRHEAVGRVDTDDPALHNRIERTDSPGYLDRGRVVEFAKVHVYRLKDS